MSGQKVLITGAAGFIGSRLLTSLAQKGHSPEASDFDLLDFAAMERTLGSKPWDSVIHLAAISHVPTCEKDPGLAYKNNVAGTGLLLEGLRKHAPQSRLYFASTAQVYAAPHGSEIQQGVTFDEEREIAPQNLYARTKWWSELLISDAVKRDGLKATILRLFNHTHKSQSPDFFLPYLYQAIQKAVKDLAQEIPIGNLEVSRDIGSIDDLLRAFQTLLDRKTPEMGLETFNICSGTAKRLSFIASELLKRLKTDIRFVTDASRVRAGEPELIVGSHRRLSEATGWIPHCLDTSSLLDHFLAD